MGERTNVMRLQDVQCQLSERKKKNIMLSARLSSFASPLRLRFLVACENLWGVGELIAQYREIRDVRMATISGRFEAEESVKSRRRQRPRVIRNKIKQSSSKIVTLAAEIELIKSSQVEADEQTRETLTNRNGRVEIESRRGWKGGQEIAE